MFEQQSKIPMTAHDGAHYRGIAYDGCYIYLTVHCACTVIQLDDCFRRIGRFNTRRAYTTICYDNDEACFWATADSCLSTIYKLNKCLEEIDCIRVRDSEGCCRPITGISYNCCDRSLMVAFSGEIIRVCPVCPEKQVCVLKAGHGCFFGVLSLCPYLLCYRSGDAGGSISIYSRNGELLHRIPVPCSAKPEGAIFWPCAEDSCRCHFIILCTKHGCYPYICDYTLICDTICDTLCQCNYEVCRQCPCPEPCGDACTDVLESVAMMEAALAHILNAEGEKIQKVIASTDDICKIIAVNESINKTMNKAIFLEQLLCCKLENLDNCRDVCAGCTAGYVPDDEPEQKLVSLPPDKRQSMEKE